MLILFKETLCRQEKTTLSHLKPSGKKDKNIQFSHKVQQNMTTTQNMLLKSWYFDIDVTTRHNYMYFSSEDEVFPIKAPIF